MNNESDCNLKTSLQIHLLIFNLLNSLDPSIFKNKQLDQRIYSVLMYIDQHIDQPLDNSILAGIANMATNSFARLFAENQNISLQNFIQKRRIENACNLLHHTDLNIDQISDLCGFSDRSHFSKIFKKQLQITPGYYKKVYSQKLTSI
jgi:transcriptional regulator GlxA family with amidase domain